MAVSITSSRRGAPRLCFRVSGHLGNCQTNGDGRWNERGSSSIQELTIGFLLQHSPLRHPLHAHSPTSASPSPPFLSYPSLLIHSERRQQQPSHACHESGIAMSSSFFSLQLYNWPAFIALTASPVCSHICPQASWAISAFSNAASSSAVPPTFRHF